MIRWPGLIDLKSECKVEISPLPYIDEEMEMKNTRQNEPEILEGH